MSCRRCLDERNKSIKLCQTRCDRLIYWTQNNCMLESRQYTGTCDYNSVEDIVKLLES